MAKSKKRKNSDYKTSIIASEETKKDSKGKGTRWDAAKSRAESRQKKKNQPKKPREKGKMKEYFRGVKLEMKKVVWPTRSELGSFTVVVLATCVVFALLFWGVDSGVLAAIKAICF
ncbi:MAG: preprotein translocase subunit SecE [Clostridia bacterium]|nr:preprotein translocase subunit SecE [Clostridia bacterium]